jgi:regulator of RNase E activity RraA
MHLGPGFRIRYDFDRPDPEIVKGIGMFETPDVSDLMNRLYTMCSAIGPVSDASLRLAGPACTVKVFPGDNLMIHKALDIARPGDVLVVDASSSMTNAVLGDITGVVVAPQEASRDLLARLVAKSAKSADYLAAVVRGTFSNEWVDAALAAAGLPVEDLRR